MSCHRVLAADAIRRLTQEEELDRKPERLLRMRWVLAVKYTEGGDRKTKARLVIGGYQHPELYECTEAQTFGKISRRPLHKLRIHVGDVSSAFHANICLGRASKVDDQSTSRSLIFVLRFFRKTCPICACVELVLWTHVSTPCVVWLDITQKLSQLGWKPKSTDPCLWCRYSVDGEL